MSNNKSYLHCVIDINNKINHTLLSFLFKRILLLFICVLVSSSVVCMSAYANVHFKKKYVKVYVKWIFICPGSVAGVPSSQGSMVPPTRVGKAPNKPIVFQAVLVKIVTETLFWQCAFGEPMIQPSWQLSFFLSLFSKTQPNHWTKRVASKRLAT